MAAAESHLEQARSNLRLMQQLFERSETLGDVAVQWAVTVAFYAALHCLEAHFRDSGLNASANHRDRAFRLAQVGVPIDVVVAYKQLEQWSRQGRYELGLFELEFVLREVLPELRTVLHFVGIHELDGPPPPPGVE